MRKEYIYKVVSTEGLELAHNSSSCTDIHAIYNIYLKAEDPTNDPIDKFKLAAYPYARFGLYGEAPFRNVSLESIVEVPLGHKNQSLLKCFYLESSTNTLKFSLDPIASSFNFFIIFTSSCFFSKVQ